MSSSPIFLRLRNSAFHALWLGALLVGTLAAQAEDAVPQAFPQGRYDQLRAHSPFSLATVQAPVAAPGPGFADNWFVSGIARIGDDDFVTIKSRDLSKQFSLYSNEMDHDTQVSLASVNWSDTVGKSTVILRKGNETAKLEFNEAEIHATPQVVNPKGPLGGTPAGNGLTGTRPVSQASGTQVPLPPMPNANPTMGRPPGAMTPAVRHRAMVIVPPQPPR